MEPQALPSDAGPLASLRALGATLLRLIGTRAELLGVELREGGERRKEMLVLACAGGVFLAMGLLLLTFLMIVVFWDTHRIAAIVGVTLVYVGLGAGAMVKLRNKLRSSPAPFQATLAEFAKDLELLRNPGE